MGAHQRRHPVHRARDGRVRRRIGGLGPHPRRDHHGADPCRDSLQRVRLPGVVCRGLAPRHVGGRNAGPANGRRTAPPAGTRSPPPGRTDRAGRKESRIRHEHRGAQRHPGVRLVSSPARDQPDRAHRPVPRASRFLGIGQDDAAAHHRRPRSRRRGRRVHRRPGRYRARRPRPERRLRVPALRALPAHERLRERRLRPARAAGNAGRRKSRSRARERAAGARAAGLPGPPAAVGALGRPAAARRARAGAGRAAGGPAA